MKSPAILFVSVIAILFVTVSSAPVDEPVALGKRAISQGIYDTLVFYFKYASSAYVNKCDRPNGNTLVARMDETSTDTQGFIARDDNKKEIVVSFRGAISVEDFIIDADFGLGGFESPGVSAPNGVQVHKGFLRAWNSVAASVISTLRTQLAAHPGYSIVTTGHSLGAALSSIAGVALKQNFPNVPVRMFTYGQPRTGNAAYANWVNGQFGLGKQFRAVHTTDPIPHIPPPFLGYVHHGVEYWTFLDPSFAFNTKQCVANIEDLTCSASIPLLVTVVTPAHLIYFNIPAPTPFCS